MTPKRLYRSRSNSMLGGVCAGIAEYFDTDPSLVRLATVIMFFAGGIGILAYIVAWIIVPAKPLKIESANQENPPAEEKEPRSELAEAASKPKFVLGMVLIVIGALFLMGNVFSWFSFFRLWPIVLIVIGILIISRGVEKGGEHAN